jgi:hypothetical protein
MTTTAVETPRPLEPTDASVDSDAVVLHRHTIDGVLVGFGTVFAIVLLVAGGLLTWGHNFSSNYVHDELSSQNISFPDAAALKADGRDDLVEWAGQRLTTGDQAQAYASFIAGHLNKIADGATYADLGAPQTAARDAVTAAKAANQPQATIDALQAQVTTITGQRTSLFTGETLRGLLLSAYAWSTVGMIAGIAAIGAFVAAGIMIVLVALGLVHLRRNRKASKKVAVATA